MAKNRQKPAPECSSVERQCAIYTRQSRQHTSVLSSCEIQQSICTDFAQESDWQIADRKFADAGESSETLERPALQQLLKEIDAGQIDRVVVYSVDRLTRKLFDLHRLLEVFERHDVQLHVVTDPRFGKSAEGRLMMNIVAAASEFQQDLTRERMADARVALKQQGRRVAGCVPYGYVVDGKSKQLIIDRQAARRVRKMFELAAAGRLPTEIAEIVNQRRWRTRRDGGGGLWTPRQILKLLSNPTYAGMIRNGIRTLPGLHEAVVDPGLFQSVREAIESRRPSKRRRKATSFASPLRGLLKCGRCKRVMIPKISQHGNIRYRYYRCRSTAGGKPPCRHVGVSAYEIERFVRSMICSISAESSTEEDGGDHLFFAIWNQLDDWSQLKRIPLIVREAVFDPDAGTIEVILLDDATERLTSSCNETPLD